MKSESKTEVRLINELAELRREVNELRSLRQNDERYRSLFSESKDAMWVATHDGKLVDVNDSACKLFGYPKNELIGRCIWDGYVNPAERQGFQREMERCGYVRDYEAKLRARDGTEMNGILTSTVWRDGEGSVVGYQGIVRDITEQKRARTALEESEKRYRLLAENATDVIWLSDMTQRAIYISPSVARVLGYSVEEAMVVKPKDLLTPVSFKFGSKVFAEQLVADRNCRGGPVGSWTVELEMKRKDGSTIWTEYIGSFVRVSDGNAVGVLGVVRDISQRKKAEEDLRRSERRFRSLIDNALDLIIVVDRDATIRYISPSVEGVDGYRAEELIGKSVYGGIHPDDLEKAVNAFNELVGKPGASQPLEFRLRHRDGSWHTVETISKNLLDDPAVAAVVSNSRDVTRRKRAEDELRNLSRRLVEIQEAERRSVARELHDEIGQSLTGLKLSLEMASVMPTAQIKAALKEAQSSVGEVMTRIHNLSLDLRPAMLDDLGLIPALLWHFERYTTKTGVRVVFKHSGFDKRFGQEVETAVYRIVQEALTNVARHAQVSEVIVRLFARQDWLVVQIDDNGVGFNVEKVLSQGTSSGLTGMRERAALIGGQLTVDSAPGLGTRVTAELPPL